MGTKDLHEILTQLARAQNRESNGMGSFLDTLDRLQKIERQLDRAISDSLELDIFSTALPGMMRRQAD